MTKKITNKQIADCFKKAKEYLIGPNLNTKNGSTRLRDNKLPFRRENHIE